MKNHTTTLLAGAALMLAACQSKPAAEALQLIPFPNEVTMLSGRSELAPPFSLAGNYSPDSITPQLFAPTGIIAADGKSAVTLLIDPSAFADAPEGAYRLAIDKQGITIAAASHAGLFYGLETLSQLCRTEAKLPCLVINDAPRFEYRGMHLDVSRHFYPVEFVKKHIDMMAQYKFNRMHWHLTDAAGWRLEIKRYPLLTDVAAWRPNKTWKEWAATGANYCASTDSLAHGGYYTQDEVRDIVRYAAERFITIIPEIELPSHSEEVLTVYPELSCTGKPHVHSDFCVGNEQTFEFLQNVFDEVLELFPSRMIHLGGDEANKQAWKECKKCQKRMADNNLKDVDELQSYMVGRMGQYLTSKGRTFIGWDEILEGGLAKDAVVMSWRGEEGGIASARMGHRAIMTPGGYCYFDSYQLDPLTQPEAIGGYLPVEKVYSYNPVPDSLTADEAKLIIGVQANLWTEYIPTTEYAEYMLHPRMEALADVAWTQPEHRSWEQFLPRINKHVELVREQGVNVCELNPHVVVSQTPDLDRHCMVVTMKSDIYPSAIHYTLDGSEPHANSPRYTHPIDIAEGCELRAVVIRDGKPMAEPRMTEVGWNKAIGKKVTYVNQWNDRYPAGGDSALVDGLVGGYGYGDGRWQGFLRDLDVTIDLEEATDLHRIKARFMQITGPGVWVPASVDIYLSDDGKEFRRIHHEESRIPQDHDTIIFDEYGFAGNERGRYVRFVAKTIGKGFIFTDEIMVN
jgi:hexosaminidase